MLMNRCIFFVQCRDKNDDQKLLKLKLNRGIAVVINYGNNSTCPFIRIPARKKKKILKDVINVCFREYIE